MDTLTTRGARRRHPVPPGTMRFLHWVGALAVVCGALRDFSWAADAGDLRDNAALEYWQAFELLWSGTRFNREVDNATTDDKTTGFGVPVRRVLAYVLEGDVDAALRLLDRAASRSECEWGSDLRKDGWTIEVRHGERAHRLARYALLRARWRFEHGEWDEGLDDVLATMAMARHIGRDKISYNIHYGCQIENMCVSTAAAYLPRMPANVRDSLSPRLLLLPKFTTMREVVLHYEDAVAWAVDSFTPADDDQAIELLAPSVLSRKEATELVKRTGGSDGLVALALEARVLRTEYAELLSLTPDEFKRGFKARFQPRLDANPLLEPLGPYYPEMRHEECTAACRLALLKAGIDVLRRGESALGDHADPYGDGPFVYAPFDDGFELCSRLTYGPIQICLDFGVRAD